MAGGRSPVLRLATAAVLIAASGGAAAQPDYPSRPIRIVVPSGPGSAPDLIPRLLGEALTARWGQPVVVEHRPGAGGNLGAEFVFKAPPTATPCSRPGRARWSSIRASTPRSTTTPRRLRSSR